jgi:hypothetical protein
MKCRASLQTGFRPTNNSILLIHLFYINFVQGLAMNTENYEFVNSELCDYVESNPQRQLDTGFEESKSFSFGNIIHHLGFVY